jgi:hypothetical protein
MPSNAWDRVNFLKHEPSTNRLVRGTKWESRKRSGDALVLEHSTYARVHPDLFGSI